MSEPSEIVLKASAYAKNILTEELPAEMEYHSLEHTEFVVKAATEIGSNSGLTNAEMEILCLGAWFHDLGYREDAKNHEEISAQMALSFLAEEQYDVEKAAQVSGCILATKMPQSPCNIMEMALCDADLLHLADPQYFKKADLLHLADPQYFKKADLLHSAMENLRGEHIAEKEWMEMNKKFIEGHSFFTDYAKENYRPAKDKNLKKVKKKLKTIKADQKIEKLQEQVEKFKTQAKEAKELKPTRGIETMFRLTSKNHLELSSIADNKANIMISINTLILSIMISVLFRKLEEYPHMVVPSIILTLVCLATIVIGILATRPNVSKGKFTRDNIRNKETNLLFFGNFHSMNLKDYEWAMKEMLNDADYLYSSLIRDIYFLGAVLGKKYRMLRLAYNVFMFGFVVSVISFVIAELFFKAPYPY